MQREAEQRRRQKEVVTRKIINFEKIDFQNLTLEHVLKIGSHDFDSQKRNFFF